jgi:chromosome segregation ATPase
MFDKELREHLQKILKNQETQMAAIDDLQAAEAAQLAQNQVVITTLSNINTTVTNLTGQVATLTAALAAAQGNTDDPAVEAAAQAIIAGIASVQAEIAAVTPAPAPTPDPTPAPTPSGN